MRILELFLEEEKVVLVSDLDPIILVLDVPSMVIDPAWSWERVWGGDGAEEDDTCVDVGGARM